MPGAPAVADADEGSQLEDVTGSARIHAEAGQEEAEADLVQVRIAGA